MAYYRKIDIRIQNDLRIRSLSLFGRTAWYDVFTSERLNTFGAMRVSLEGLSYDMVILKWEPKAFVKAIQESIEKDLIKFDPAMLLWFPKFLKYNAPASNNVIKSWPNLLDNLPPCSLKNEIISYLVGWLQLPTTKYVSTEGLIEGLKKGLTEGLNKDLALDDKEDPFIVDSLYLRVKEGSGKPLEGKGPPKACRVPDDFILTAERRQMAVKIGLNGNIDQVFAGFLDYWKAQPGAKGIKLDWDATLRNWFRNELKYRKPEGQHSGLKPNFR